MNEQMDERGHGWRHTWASGRGRKSFIIFGQGGPFLGPLPSKSNLFPSTDLKLKGNLLQSLPNPVPEDAPFHVDHGREQPALHSHSWEP